MAESDQEQIQQDEAQRVEEPRGESYGESSSPTSASDTGVQKAQGASGGAGGSGPQGSGNVQHEGAIIDEEHHGWAPDAGPPSDAIVEAGNKSFDRPAHTQNESEQRRESMDQ